MSRAAPPKRKRQADLEETVRKLQKEVDDLSQSHFRLTCVVERLQEQNAETVEALTTATKTFTASVALLEASRK